MDLRKLTDLFYLIWTARVLPENVVTRLLTLRHLVLVYLPVGIAVVSYAVTVVPGVPAAWLTGWAAVSVVLHRVLTLLKAPDALPKASAVSLDVLPGAAESDLVTTDDDDIEDGGPVEDPNAVDPDALEGV